MPILELQSISKHFGAIRAVDEFSVAIEQGSVVGLMGDNGAGKSTLLKVIAGNFRPSAGEILVEGQRVHFTKPSDARHYGIEVVYQDLALCSNLTAAQNIFLGRERTNGWGPLRRLSAKEMNSEAERLLGRLKSDTPTDGLICNFSGGQRQAVAIARTLLSEPRIVLMDEPLAAISVRQVKEVLELIRELRSHGVTVLLISHRLPDIFAVCDRILVMRRGRKVGDKIISNSSPEEVTGLITGGIDEAFE